jgi:hypothetical protein
MSITLPFPLPSREEKLRHQGRRSIEIGREGRIKSSFETSPP